MAVSPSRATLGRCARLFCAEPPSLCDGQAPDESEDETVPDIRRATIDDAGAIASILHLKRLQYAEYQPTFWRVAPDAEEQHQHFLRKVLGKSNTIAFVAEADSSLIGVVIAGVIPPPPVYAPGGPTCAIDDFWVVDRSDWPTVGRALMAEVLLRAREEFAAAQAVVVCARRDTPKREMLRAESFSIASEWWTLPL